MSGRRTVFLRRLHKILAEDVNSGNFSRPGIDAGGHPCVHHFAWAVGMASTNCESMYRTHFGIEVPDWCELCNPYHVSRLCETAIEAKLRLTKTYPADEQQGGDE